MKAIELLQEQFGNFVRLEEKRPNVQQVVAPLYHEDGDMMDLFLDLPKNADLLVGQRIRLSDHGMTLRTNNRMEPTVLLRVNPPPPGGSSGATLCGKIIRRFKYEYR